MHNERVERLAAHCHEEQWAGWMEHLFSKCRSTDEDGGEALVIPARAVERWKRQMNSPYRELPQEERESYRAEARGILRALGEE